MAFSQFDERVLQTFAGSFGLASGGVSASPMTATTFGTRLDTINVSSRDSVDRSVSLIYTDGFGDYATLATAIVPAGAGTSPGVPAIDLLDRVPGVAHALIMQASAQVLLHANTATTGDNDLDYYIQGGSF